MNIAVGIQNAIDYIEEHLTDNIDYNQLAKKACISNFYFQRIFGALCGYSIGDYIRFRRLALAGSELVNSDVKVIDTALKCMDMKVQKALPERLLSFME
ncbi:MAG: AraC family transcriptional regulator [Clostridium sp.]|nr:AraC family transcriptional regulator [Clostridium sp.]